MSYPPVYFWLIVQQNYDKLGFAKKGEDKILIISVDTYCRQQ